MTRRGELRIYLGAAPGVGKTYAMLGEAAAGSSGAPTWSSGSSRPTAGRKTAELLDGLEVVPRRRSPPRRRLDRAGPRRRAGPPAPRSRWSTSSRTPTPPGLAQRKRWQDVEELLDAGIDVLTTVNVQHLESLNDVVERITGVRQRETVPDEVVRRAEQIELVDITPEALRRRMAHGNIYAAEKVDAALANYFRPATSPRCASWPCSGWPTRSTSRCSATAADSTSPRPGRPASGWSSR